MEAVEVASFLPILFFKISLRLPPLRKVEYVYDTPFRKHTRIILIISLDLMVMQQRIKGYIWALLNPFLGSATNSNLWDVVVAICMNTWTIL